MRLLSRYVVGQLLAPFVFALAALTSIMILNQVAKRFGGLVGKGLPWGVIADVFILSVPFIVAMTLPMAVLVAVLYAFSHLAADQEITAMRASGVSVGQILVPVFVWGAAMSVVNFGFVDQVLPRTNAKLRNLLLDIGRKKPTFELREQIINEIPPSQYFLRAGRIDAATGRLRDVTIYDVGGQAARRIIYADSGVMGYAPGGIDLGLRLYHGSIHQFRIAEPDVFQITYFVGNDIRVKNVFDQLQRNTDETVRGDREMTTCEMLGVIDSAAADAAQSREERRRLALRDLDVLLGAAPAPAPPIERGQVRPRPAYCGWLERVGRALLPKTAHAATIAQTAPRDSARPSGPPDSQSTAQARPTPPPAFVPPPMPLRGQLTSWAEVATTADRMRDSERRAARYAVEVHKKWALSAACITFVLIGIGMALKFPRGGMGLVIGGGLLVFAIYYMGLTAGESLADREYLKPWVAMWSPNILFFIAGVIGLWRVNRQMGSTRGGTEWRERLADLAALLRRAPGFRKAGA